MIIFFSADWDSNSKVIEAMTFSDRRVIQMIRRKSVTPILVDCSDLTPAVADAYRQHGINTTPYVYVYFSDSRDLPKQLSDVPSASEVLAAFIRPQPSAKVGESG